MSLPDPDLIAGVTFTAVFDSGKWLPAKVDLATGKITKFLFGFEKQDAAIDYALDNL